jgi:tetratricopeptide (TPR) repeat protein
MASRVNVKFVVLLSTALGLVFVGVAGALVYAKLRSGDRYARLAAEAAAKGDIETADNFYGRAVGKEPTNVVWLQAWRGVMLQKVPATQSAAQTDYGMLTAINRSLALAKRTDLQAHRDYLDMIYERLMNGASSREGWEFLIGEAEGALRYFEPETPAPLRRYRGMAIATLFQLGADVDKERRLTGMKDLEASLQADPKDVLAANDLAGCHERLAALARTTDPDAARAEIETARKIIDEAARADEANPITQTIALNHDLVRELAALDTAGKSNADIVKARTATIATFEPRAREIHAKFMSADPKTFSRVGVDRWCTLAPAILAKEGPEMAGAVLDRALSASPESPDFLFVRALFTYRRSDFEGSITQFQKLADLKNLPVSWPGLRLWQMRTLAVYYQANAAISLVFKANDPEPRKAALARARTFRQTLARNVPENSPQLQLVDGKLLVADGDLLGAQRLLAAFVKTPGDASDQMSDALLFLADIGEKTNQLGMARENLLKVRDLRPPSGDLLMLLANIEKRLQNPSAAAGYLRQVLDIDPGNEAAKRDLAVVLAVQSGDTNQIDDPVMRLLAEAERVMRGDNTSLGDDQRAIKIVEDGLEAQNYDPRLVAAAIQLRLASGDREGALRTAQAAQAKHPDNERLSNLVKGLQASGSLEGMLALVDASPLSDLEKWLNRRSLYEQYGKNTEAVAALAEAVKLAPADARVIELQFRDALAANDQALAGRLADAAAQSDADRAMGDTFKARLQIAQGNVHDAVITLQRAADRGNATPGVYRVLGLALLQLGRGQEAVAALNRARGLNPADLVTTRTLMNALVQLGRTKEALDVARESEVYARRDPDFMNLWLTLEASGGNAAFARERREQILTLSPSDLNNKGALAGIYMDQKAWDKARTLIDQLKTADPTSTPIAALEARWYADRGDMDAALKVFVDHLGALSAKQNPLPPDPYLVMAEFLLKHGRQREGIAALRQAETLQDPKTMRVTILLAEALVSISDFGEAQKSYRKALDAGVPDPDRVLRKRLIDTCVQSQDFTAAENEFAALGPAGDADVELMCQHAQIARGRGDKNEAMAILNRAVAKFPDEPLPYLRRARLEMNERALVQDAMADLATTLRLRPGMWQALHTRYTLLLNQGKVAEGIKDLRAAVDANPTFDQLRFELVDVLLAAGKEADAAEVADAAIKDRPNDLRLPQGAGDRFARTKRYNRAARYYKMVFDQATNEAAAVQYVYALVSSSPPSLNEAEAVLNSPSLNVDKSWGLLMSRSLLRKKQGNDDQARADASDALALVEGESAMLVWYERFRQVYPDPAPAHAALATLHAKGTLDEWIPYFRARCQSQVPSARNDGLSAMSAMLDQPGKSRTLRLDLCRSLSGAYLQDQKWDDASKVLRRGLELDPNDVEFNNNLACVLSDNMKNAGEAMPLAQKAAKLAPDNPLIVDTLASVQWSTGQKDEAIRNETTVLRLALTEADKVKYGTKLAMWKAQNSDRAGARALLDWINDMLTDSPRLKDSVSADQEQTAALDALNKELQGASK